MITPARRMIEVSGAEALWLLEGAPGGRLVYVQREVPVVRPAAHVLEYGRLIVRVPAPAAAFSDSATVTFHCDHVSVTSGRGWSVTATGPAEVIRDPNEAAHYRRTLMGWTHGPHDTLIRIHPQIVHGYRLGTPAGAETPAHGIGRSGTP
ncbi:pyridoxamine 5'-phosphate oxidase family protein [Actinacidiphila glaucinigra]|uniref:pyridoxamine 5'-phosphate oxidase family protein n=1 Tax=Actinacidiphila glaucinigra TaxID=235986 RepID=UPI002DD8B193|nr:pyridoxamine 5'-phosphate oxidase family protein [Actinacidiphila glaucinigra]WSD64945.1 pyridoxamine 5'-phosphate oxidase family protein [Actinacidiphila glaucinigra]